MTLLTNRFNIKPAFWLVTMMMVLFCLLTARALQGIWTRYSVMADSMCDSIFCLNPFRKFCVIPKRAAFLSSFISISSTIAFTMSFTLFALLILALSSLKFFALPMTFLGNFTFFCLIMAFVCSLTLFALSVSLCANLASPIKTIFRPTVFAKLRSWLIFLALAASFCFSYFRHGFFLFKKLCFEPLQTQYLCGSLYYNNSWGGVK